MTMLRFYIATKPKPSANADSDTVEETSEFNLVSGENDDYTDVIIVLDDTQRSLDISSDPEITFGPHFGIEEDEEDTLIFENVPIPASP
ncbi:Pentatricopeptide repeat-containing protein [Dissostichus eleginoides]|uniref:Pentatricopeptide repeat-containing protein n=1 Tax=Dissostichus eleginoides TaxID=100907 RepID=A0AAD9FJN4_DISEL|nr:Pentatricopeptide repeat-containing protein [Dissostichus eleginoides]